MSLSAEKEYRAPPLFRFLATASSAAILLAPQVFPPCGSQLKSGLMAHHCTHTFAVVSGLALVALAVSIVSWWTRNPHVRIAFAALLVGLAAGALAAPQSWALGICRRADMACHQTALATAIPAAVLLIAAIGLLFRSITRARAAQVSPPDPWEADQRQQPDDKKPR
jgi:hypothetical protein